MAHKTNRKSKSKKAAKRVEAPKERIENDPCDLPAMQYSPPSGAMPANPVIGNPSNMAAKKSKGAGRPPGVLQGRYQVRYLKTDDADQMEAWKAAAAFNGMKLQTWIRNALDVAAGVLKGAK